MSETITIEQIWELFRETDRQMKENALRFQETDRIIQESNQQTSLRFQETDRKIQETNRETARKLREVGKQIGGLGEKFGYFTEGMALPSMERILTRRFGMTAVMPRAKFQQGSETLEIDVLAYANGEKNQAILVEVKSQVKLEAIEQLQQQLLNFRRFSPEHATKSLIGILAGVHWQSSVEQEARKAGFFTASIHENVFEITTPKTFQPTYW